MSSTIDKRIRNLSYSSLLTLHSCPRKYQLYKLGSTTGEQQEDKPGSITFAYGHLVGTGIQELLEGKTLNQTILNAFANWSCDIFDENPKQNKSFWSGIHALRQFSHMRANGYLDGYELVYYDGKPACELSFAIELPDGFVYRGFVDAVLQHESTGEIIVLECKTTGLANVNPATYKNSAQAIGYSIVLDAMFPTLSSYKVLYLIYLSKQEEFIQLPFDKSYYQRALWIQELLLDIEMIKLYESQSIFPMHGESCYSFFRECEYYQVCTLSTKHLTNPLTAEQEEKMDEDLNAFQIRITLSDLINAQIAKENNTPAIDTFTRSNGDMIL